MPILFSADKSVEKDLNHFEGKPTILIYIAGNTKSEKTEIEVQMPINWKMKDLIEVIKESLHQVDGIVSSVHVKSAKLDYSKLN
ncbi:hypothetical protein [uncultured Winogradskyella sp.]|uniref:hypothetical protein n=1 Tax=uncultured Winogradskyella sp. TaxID=395353 RepID=UPI00262452ED|nr:hypothetical protein [uncultured Winogradskyella sp.]